MQELAFDATRSDDWMSNDNEWILCSYVQLRSKADNKSTNTSWLSTQVQHGNLSSFIIRLQEGANLLGWLSIYSLLSLSRVVTEKSCLCLVKVGTM